MTMEPFLSLNQNVGKSDKKRAPQKFSKGIHKTGSTVAREHTYPSSPRSLNHQNHQRNPRSTQLQHHDDSTERTDKVQAS